MITGPAVDPTIFHRSSAEYVRLMGEDIERNTRAQPDYIATSQGFVHAQLAASPAPSATRTHLCQKCQERSKHACEVKDQDFVKNSRELSVMYNTQCHDSCYEECN